MSDVNRISDFVPDDATLEYAARLIEESSLLDMRGCLAENRAGQLEFAIQLEAREETRKDCAEHIRAMKARPELDARAVLARIASEIEGSRPHDMLLVDAWPLAWKGWLTIEARIKCNSNSVPPVAVYRIELTDKGRQILDAISPPASEGGDKT